MHKAFYEKRLFHTCANSVPGLSSGGEEGPGDEAIVGVCYYSTIHVCCWLSRCRMWSGNEALACYPCIDAGLLM